MAGAKTGYIKVKDWIGRVSLYETYAVFRIPLRILSGKPRAYRIEKVENDVVVIRIIDWVSRDPQPGVEAAAQA